MGCWIKFGVSFYFGRVPLVLWPTLLNFGLLYKNRRKSLSEHSRSCILTVFDFNSAISSSQWPVMVCRSQINWWITVGCWVKFEVSLYFGPVPLVLWPAELNFGLLYKNRRKSLSEHGRSCILTVLNLNWAISSSHWPVMVCRS